MVIHQKDTIPFTGSCDSVLRGKRTGQIGHHNEKAGELRAFGQPNISRALPLPGEFPGCVPGDSPKPLKNPVPSNELKGDANHVLTDSSLQPSFTHCVAA